MAVALERIFLTSRNLTGPNVFRPFAAHILDNIDVDNTNGSNAKAPEWVDNPGNGLLLSGIEEQRITNRTIVRRHYQPMVDFVIKCTVRVGLPNYHGFIKKPR